MEFCQIQLNYLDWTLQDAKRKYELLTERGIAVWVMEPVRGGKLAYLNEENSRKLREARSEESDAAWSFRFLQRLDNVKVILSGMSNMEQLEENIKIFSEDKPLTDTEAELLLEIAESLKDSVPCTACRYCCDGCPMELDIPFLINKYNDFKIHKSVNIAMLLEMIDENKKPSACIGCGKCTQICPQNIDIPNVLKDFAQMLSKMPSWVEECKKREKLLEGI